MTGKPENAVVAIARDYYNSDDADNFYYHIWGGEDIHIGIYEHPTEDIATASRRTVSWLSSKVPHLGNQSRVLDLGAGFGGAARYLATTYGCQVTALNLSDAENTRHRAMNAAAGLNHLIAVIDGDFADIPSEAEHFDLVWSQDAFLHSPARAQVIGEAARVLKPDGHLLFTDPMQADDCPDGVLQPVLDRIHLASLGSCGFYRQAALATGLTEIEIEIMTPQLTRHYARVRDELERQRTALNGKVSNTFIDRMLAGLQHWVDAGENGYLAWGSLHFQKPHS